jgi:hypothetical protein
VSKLTKWNIYIQYIILASILQKLKLLNEIEAIDDVKYIQTKINKIENLAPGNKKKNAVPTREALLARRLSPNAAYLRQESTQRALSTNATVAWRAAGGCCRLHQRFLAALFRAAPRGCCETGVGGGAVAAAVTASIFSPAMHGGGARAKNGGCMRSCTQG